MDFSMLSFVRWISLQIETRISPIQLGKFVSCFPMRFPCGHPACNLFCTESAQNFLYHRFQNPCWKNLLHTSYLTRIPINIIGKHFMRIWCGFRCRRHVNVSAGPTCFCTEIRNGNGDWDDWRIRLNAAHRCPWRGEGREGGCGWRKTEAERYAQTALISVISHPSAWIKLKLLSTTL